jgi:DNA-binding NarL/FixJ family response regulator
MSISIVIADDHPLLLQGLVLLLRQEPDFQVVAACRDGEEALQAVRRLRPDILILDILMPGRDGLAVLRELRQGNIPTRVILLITAIDEDNLLEALRLGVSGVVLKEMAVAHLIQCVRKVYADEQWLERHSIGHALESMVRREAGTRKVAKTLTPREAEVVRLAARGLRNKEIADKLTISEGTVKVHLRRTYEKLPVDNRIALQAIVVRMLGSQLRADNQVVELEAKPIQIFLCHASEDEAAVLDIYDRLRAIGYKPWMDKKDLLPGQRWQVEIPNAIRTSNSILICLSKTSVAKRGYVQNEFQRALKVLREISVLTP